MEKKNLKNSIIFNAILYYIVLYIILHFLSICEYIFFKKVD